MIVSKEHLTESGRLKIESLRSNMNSLRKFASITSHPPKVTPSIFIW